MEVLAAALSKSGCEKLVGIMEGDEALRKRNGGVRRIFGQAEYYLPLLGAPAVNGPWSTQFSGHHLALKITLAGEHGRPARGHTAPQPAKFTLDGKVIRSLGVLPGFARRAERRRLDIHLWLSGKRAG